MHDRRGVPTVRIFIVATLLRWGVRAGWIVRRIGATGALSRLPVERCCRLICHSAIIRRVFRALGRLAAWSRR